MVFLSYRYPSSENHPPTSERSERTINQPASEVSEPTIVLKFGGTSVASPERWETIARVTREHLDDGRRPLLVCSALGGVTDRIEELIETAAAGDDPAPVLSALREQHADLAEALGVMDDSGTDESATWETHFDTLQRLAQGLSLTRHAPPALRAQALAQGELMSTRIGAAYLDEHVLPTRWLDARTALRSTPGAPNQPEAARYLSADCDFAPDAALQKRLAETGGAMLTQGFIAADGNASSDDESGPQTVLIGRGGSDTSAAYFAAKLEAERLEIWTDVPGLFTADPRSIPSARLLRQLHYAEAQEMATTGASVLHPRCLRPLRESGIPLHIRCTPDPDVEHTVISDEAADPGPQVKSISTKRGVVLISMETLGMWQQAGFLGNVFGVFQRHGLSVDLVATSESEVTVTLDAPAQALTDGALDALMSDLEAHCEPTRIGPCAQVSLVGRRIRAILHKLGPALGVFEEQHAHLVTQAASDLNLSFVVDEEQAERLARELHAQLFGAPASSVEGASFGPSWEHLLGRPPEPPRERAWWRDRRDDLLALADEEDAPVYVYDEETLRASVRRLEQIDAADRFFYAVKANAHPGVLRLFEKAGLGFECVSPGEVRHVERVLPELPAERILFTPNFAPRSEYAFAAERDGLHLTLDNLHPLRAWPEVFAERDVILRLDPGQGRGHHEHVRTAGAQSKFGIAPAHLERARALVDEAGARVVGLHAHVGSGIVAAAETWAETAAFLSTQAENYFPDARFFNVGGGLGVAEHPEGRPLDLDDVSDRLETFKDAHPDTELWMEPGRFLVAHAGVLLARVTQLKQKTEATSFVGLETGMNSLIRPALYGSYHEIRNLTRLGAPDAMTAEVVGPICESGDVLGHDRRLPETKEGDCLLVATTGAYGRVMSSRYNERGPAGERLLGPKGAVQSEAETASASG
jgi:diaminopimelate decarboxylase/aspartate kinase